MEKYINNKCTTIIRIKMNKIRQRCENVFFNSGASKYIINTRFKFFHKQKE